MAYEAEKISRRAFFGESASLTAGGLALLRLGGVSRAEVETLSAEQLKAGADVSQLRMDRFDFSFLPACDFMFAVVSDTHAHSLKGPWDNHEKCFTEDLAGVGWNKRGELNNARTQKVYDQLNANGPDFVLHLGDLTTSHPQRPRWDEEVRNAQALLGRLKMPHHLVAGNHDIGNKLSLPIPKWPATAGDPHKSFHVSAENIDLYSKAFGRPYHSFEHRNCLFITITESVFNSGWDIEKKQWQWLEGLLRDKYGKVANIFVCMHCLAYWNDVRDASVRNYEVIDEPGRSRLLRLFEKYEVRAVLTGHTHLEILQYHKGTWMVTTPSTTFSRDSWGIYGGRSRGRDAARACYNYVRVGGKKVVKNLVRTVDLLPPVVCMQKNNPFGPQRLMGLGVKDGRPCDLAVTAPIIWQRRAEGHAELAIDGVRSTPQGRGRGRDSRIGWQWASGPTDGTEWLQVELARDEELDRVVVYPGGAGSVGSYEISISLNGSDWTTVAGGRQLSDARPVEHKLGGKRGRLVRLDVAIGAGKAAVIREMEVYNKEGINVADRRCWAEASASSKRGRREDAKNTNSFCPVFDLNPSIIRLAEEATAWETVSPLPGVLSLSRWAAESVDYAVKQGGRVCVVLTAENRHIKAADRARAFGAYCAYVAEKLKGAGIWEVRGGQDDFRLAAEQVRAVMPNAVFACWKHVAGADYFVTEYGGRIPETRGSTILVFPEFRSARKVGPAKELIRNFVAGLKDERLIPCFSLRNGAGLLDDLDNPMYAYYALRTLGTVFGGAKPGGAVCRPIDGVETISLSSPVGRLVVLDSPASVEADMVLVRAARQAWIIDPFSASTRQLVVEGNRIPRLLLPDYPVIVKLT